MYDLSLKNGMVYIDGHLVPNNVYVKNGVISKITPDELGSKEVVDCSNKFVFPGFIDPHVHLNLHLGEFTSADDYRSGSITAAYGGVTTFIDFLEPINTLEEFEEKLEDKKKEGEISHIDYSFHPTLGNYRDNVRKLIDKIIEAGLPSVKVFTTYSDSDRRISYEKLKELLQVSKESNILVLVHAENDEIIITSGAEDTIERYEETRPAKAEIEEIEKLAKFLEKIKGNLYIVHLTCGNSLELLKRKYSQLLGNSIFIESCPQYFVLSKEVYKTEKGFLYLLAPPLRSTNEQELLRRNIDMIHTIGTDHCPFKKAEKLGYSKPSLVPKGIGGIEHSFSLMYSLFGLKIVDKFTINPAKIHGLYPRKGVIKEGSDADLVIFNPNRKFVISSWHSNGDYDPYEGIEVNGLVETTILRGNFIVKNGKFVGEEIEGKLLRRNFIIK